MRLKANFDSSTLDTSAQYEPVVGTVQPRTQDSMRWNTTQPHEAPVYGRNPDDRGVPVLVRRRNEMWASVGHSRNLFRTSFSSRLASIERSLDKSLLSAQRVPTTPADIVRCSQELSTLRAKNAERTRQTKLGELKHLKRSRRPHRSSIDTILAPQSYYFGLCTDTWPPWK